MRQFGLMILILVLSALVTAENETSINDTKITSQEIMDHLDHGRSLDYNGITINSNLDARRNATHIDITSIKIENAKIYGKLDLDDISIEGPSSFKGTIFWGPITFNDSQFGGTADFSGCTFHGPVYFEEHNFSEMPILIIRYLMRTLIYGNLNS